EAGGARGVVLAGACLWPGGELQRRGGEPALPVFGYLTNRVWSAYLSVAIGAGFTGIVEDVMRLELQYRSDVDLSQPAMQVEIRSHILRCLRDFPQGGDGVITLGDTVHDDVVDTVIGPPDYVQQVAHARFKMPD